MGILAAIAIPRLTGFRASAVDQTNEANAKMLTSVAQIVNADTGNFPTATEWPMTNNTVTVTQATINGKVYITEDVVFETGGTHTEFSYDPATGIVTTTP